MRHQLSRVVNQISQHRECLGRQWYSFICSALQFAPETFVDEIKSKRGEMLHISLPVHFRIATPSPSRFIKNFLKTESKPQENDFRRQFH